MQVSLTIFTPGTVQIAKTPLAGRVLNLPFLVFFSLCFMARGPRDGYPDVQCADQVLRYRFAGPSRCRSGEW